MKPARFATTLAAGLLAIAPSGLTAGTLSTEVEGFRAELTSSPEGPRAGQETTYTVRLLDRRGAPVHAAKVTLGGRMGDGMTVLTPLRASAEAGLYGGRLLFTMEGTWQLTLRVTLQSRRFELPLTERVGR